MLSRRAWAYGIIGSALWLALGGCGERGTLRVPEPSRAPIDHIIVLFQENRTFDHYFGHFPGADGLANEQDSFRSLAASQAELRGQGAPASTSERIG